MKHTKHTKHSSTVKSSNSKTTHNQSAELPTIEDLVRKFASTATMITDEMALEMLEASEGETEHSIKHSSKASTRKAGASATNTSSTSSSKKTKPKKFKSPIVDKQLLESIKQKSLEQAQQQADAKQLEDGADFASFLLEPKIIKNLADMEFLHATNIQEQVIPQALEGKNILGVAATGTGKTLSYLIPAVQTLFDYPSRSRDCKVLIVAPTRDLVQQIYKLTVELIKGMKFSVGSLLGKLTTDSKSLNSIEEAIEVFTNNQIVVASPGRLANELRTGQLDLSEIHTLVVDEIDRTLEAGMVKDIETIFNDTASRHQTLFFSATTDNQVEDYFNSICPENSVIIKAKHLLHEKTIIEQCYYHCDSVEHKLQLLINILKDQHLNKTLVFVKKKETVTRVTKFLMNQKQGIRATQIDGDMNKEQRARALGLFSQNKVQVLVTTDLLARGIDIQGVQAVVNFDIPFDGETYIHRIGRTGRLGNKGLVINLVEAHDYYNLGKAMRFTHEHIVPKIFPGLEPLTSVNPNALTVKLGTTVKTKKTKAELKIQARKIKKENKPKIKIRTFEKKNKGFPKKFKNKIQNNPQFIDQLQQ